MIINICSRWQVPPVAPAPATVLPAAVQQAIDKLTADTQAYSLASGSLASAQAALAAAQNQLTALQSQAAALQAAIPQDQAAVTAAIASAFGSNGRTWLIDGSSRESSKVKRKPKSTVRFVC